MIQKHPVRQADVETAETLLVARRPAAQVIASLVYRGLDPTEATKLVANLQAGKEPNVQPDANSDELEQDFVGVTDAGRAGRRPDSDDLAVKRCPACESANTRSASGRARGFQPFRNRMCKDCGAVWRPACPRALALVLIMIGIALPLGWLFTEASIESTNRALDQALARVEGVAPQKQRIWGWTTGWVFSIGLGVAFYGFSVLRGRAGQLHILGNVKAMRGVAAPLVRPAVANKGHSSTGCGGEITTGIAVDGAQDTLCVACLRPIRAKTRFCPYCGWTQPSGGDQNKR